MTAEWRSYYLELHQAAPGISSQDWAYFHLVDTISDQIAECMNAQGITQSALADRLGSKPSFVSRVLAGDTNLTLKTLSRFLFHLNLKAEIRLVPAENVRARWFCCMENNSQDYISVCNNVIEKSDKQPVWPLPKRQEQRVAA